LGAINGPDKSGKVRTDKVFPPCPRAGSDPTDAAGSAAVCYSADGSAGLSQREPLHKLGLIPVPQCRRRGLGTVTTPAHSKRGLCQDNR
jgi:hypothetical protein